MLKSLAAPFINLASRPACSLAYMGLKTSSALLLIMTVVPSYFADQIDLSLLAFSLASTAVKPYFQGTLTLSEESFVFLKEAIPLALITKVECCPAYLL